MTRARSLSQLANSSVFTVATNNRVGIGSEIPTTKLDVDGALNVSGNAAFGGVITYEDVTNIDSVGIITARTDLSIADKIIHTGDTNTAIRFPTADTVTVETAGSERVRIKSDGTLHAIKTGTQITNAEQTVAVFQRSSASGTTSKISIVSGNGAASHINFGDTDDEDIGQLIYDHSNNSMQFLTNTSERLRIDSSGKMGLGTNSPVRDLHIHGSNADVELVLTNSTTGATAGNGFMIQQDGNDAYIWNKENSFLSIATNAVERIRIDASGNMGLGTNNPTSNGGITLEIYHNTTPTLKLNDGGDYKALFQLRGNDLEIRGSNGAMEFYTGNADGASSTEVMRIDSSGRLLINHTADTAPAGYASKLQLCDTSYQGSSMLLRRDVNSASSPTLLFTKTRSSSKGGSTIIQDGDDVGSIMFFAGDGTDANCQTAFILSSVDGTPGSNDMPGRLTFHTTADGATASTERMRIDSSGRLLLGTATANGYTDRLLTVGDASTSSVTAEIRSSSQGQISFSDGVAQDAGSYRGIVGYNHGSDYMYLYTNATERMRIDNSGNIGMGENSPSSYDSGARNLVVGSTGHAGILIKGGTSSYSNLYFGDGTGSASYRGFVAYNHSEDSLRLGSAGTERLRIDSSGRLLVQSTSAPTQGIYSQYAPLTVQGYIGAATGNGIINIARGAAAAGLSNNTDIGTLVFSDSAGGEFARISCFVDAAPGSSDYPGRLSFHTTADGASSPTERMRITSAGDIHIGKTTANFSIGGSTLYNNGAAEFVMNAGTVMNVNRMTNDGRLIGFYQNSSLEGDISVSGTTVSYNGAHLSRWSQLPGGAERTEILRGSVLSNLDEMCEWGEEDNEQLNRMQVSDVEGDRNVAGVFQDWDDDDDVYTNDFHCAMTGDFVIRIAQGTTVARGDLLMSAGDGTAKPQDDDIVRSKTIAKVTSTTVSATYSDGSYCVPCVLMAC